MNVRMIGEGYFEELVAADDGDSDVFIDKVSKAELKKLHNNIKVTVRPNYRQGPPKNLGSRGHGKLKADQWKTCIEFDIPVFVARFWSRETAPQGQESETTFRRDRIYRTVMDLAVAVRWGTSYRTSEHHSRMFDWNMKAYLEGLLELYPNIQLRPNHHTALHVGPTLPQLGPSPGWWMYPFERIIGILQKIKTNNKMGKRSEHRICALLTWKYSTGELEETMLRTFYAGANLKALLQSERCPVVLKAAVSLLQKKWDQDKQTGTMGEVHNLGNIDIKRLDDGKKVLPTKVWEVVLENCGSRSKAISSGELRLHKRVMIAGRMFASEAQSRRDAEIFFQHPNSRQLVPGLIIGIYSFENGDEKTFILSVKARKPPPSQIPNPFTRYPDFNAELWSTEFESEVLRIPVRQLIYHSEGLPWAQHVLVLKPIKLVSISTKASKLFDKTYWAITGDLSKVVYVTLEVHEFCS